MTALRFFQQAGVLFLALLFLFLLGNLWFHLVEGLLGKIKGFFFPEKELPWHSLPQEDEENDAAKGR